MIKILDNIIPKKQQEELKKILHGSEFPWYYVSDIAKKDNEYQSRPGFSHIFYVEGKQNSFGNCVDIVNKISENVNKKIKKQLSLYQVRTFLQLPLNETLIHKGSKHKEDTPHLDCNIPHTVFLYYVNDADGDTILYDYLSKNIDDVPNYEDIKIIDRMTPKQGRVIVFDGMTWHSSSQPTKGPRCIINFDMV